MRAFSLSLIFIYLLSACTPIAADDLTSTPPVEEGIVTTEEGENLNTAFETEAIPMEIGYGIDGGWYELYFTDPIHRDARSYRGGPDEKLAEAIDAARLSVDLAVYSFSLWSIRDALIDALHRGVQVRVVMESDNMKRDVPQELMDAGIPILGDRREGLMHDKFVIIDRAELWVGSMNFTVGGGYQDNNNLFRFYSQKLIENYQTEFDEMFVGDHFGPDTVSDTPNHVIFVNGTMIENYFSPDDGVADVLVDLLADAEKSIYFMAYSFTSDPISEIIRERAAQGVYVAGIMDYSQVASNQGGEFDVFAQSGIDVREDGIEGLMHHKVFIIDEKIVVTGSYNFSASAEERNDENIIILYDRDIAKAFLQEFERVQAVAQESMITIEEGEGE